MLYTRARATHLATRTYLPVTLSPPPHLDADPGPSLVRLALDADGYAALLLADVGFGPWLGLGILLCLLAASALVSGSEVAFFSLSNADYDGLRDEATRSARRILYLKQRPYRLLATILIANNFVNIAIVLLSEFVIRRAFPDARFEGWADGLAARLGGLHAGLGEWLGGVELAGGLRFLVTVIGVTFLLVLFGEVTPKVYARSQNLQLSRLMSAPLTLLLTAFAPLSAALVRSGRFLEDRLRRHQGAQAASREELDEAIDLTVRDEADLAGERDILKRLVTFGDVTARQIMRSRSDIVALPADAPFAEVLALVRESSYSRIPVYEEDLDRVVGILYAKDLIRHTAAGPDFAWRALVRDSVVYAPESKRVHELLREFQAERMHMAIVVDEFGGTSGLVTLEDILEEVIGDIKDEFDDDAEIEYERIDRLNFRFEGKTQLTDALRIMSLPSGYLDGARGESDTLAGVMLEQIGFLPRPKRVVDVGGLKLQAESVTRRRIERVRITLPEALVEAEV